MKDQPAEPIPPQETGPLAEQVEAQQRAEQVEPPRRPSVSLDSEPMRAGARVEVGNVDAGPVASLEQRFEMAANLGRGGMGSVQRARDRRLLREVAVKVIHGHLDWGPHQARFAREAQITAQLQHPNIVPVYSYERGQEGGAAIVMQLVEGRTLHAFLRDCRQAVHEGTDRQPPYDLGSRLEVLIKACDAVQYAHDHGVIHRDLKPANIMLGEHGEVYVMDWGLAGVTDVADEVIRASAAPTAPSATDSQSGHRPRGTVPSEDHELTREGDIFGTPQYMSPEQARGDTSCMGPASDQFALGLLLFEMAFLKPPRTVPPDGNMVVVAAHGWTDKPEHFAGRAVPAALRQVLKKATAVRSEDRYPSVQALASDLRRVQQGVPPSVVHESALQRAWRRFNQNPVRAMRIVLAFVLATGLALTSALWLKLQAERLSASEKERIVALSAGVGERAQRIEDALGEVETVVNGWAKAAEQALLHSEPGEPGAVAVDVLREAGEDAGMRYSPRHGQRVSNRHASYLLSPQADETKARMQLGQIAHLTPFLKRWLRDDTGAPGTVAGRVSEPLPLLWVYLALQSGVLVTYPGNVSYPPDYDPTLRPWYRDAFAEGHTHCRPPYRSLSGGEIQLPCVAPLHDARGAPMGVVGVDLAVSDLRERLREDEEPAWRQSWLLDREGRVLASTALAVPEPEGTDDLEKRGVDFEPFPVEAVHAAVLEGAAGTALEVDGLLYVLQRLSSQGWTIVASFDRDVAFALQSR